MAERHLTTETFETWKNNEFKHYAKDIHSLKRSVSSIKKGFTKFEKSQSETNKTVTCLSQKMSRMNGVLTVLIPLSIALLGLGIVMIIRSMEGW